VFTAVIGMLLAAPGLPPLDRVVFATVGIALVAGAAAAFNCLVEQKLDAVMARTRGRPTVVGTISAPQILLFSGGVGGLGLAILWHAVNPLTMWLTLGTFVGYAIVYTVLLKPNTPQNIVIGGASGAMPPVLGWAAISGDVTFQPLLLFLIIFAWTPPHFWSLALYRTEDYAKAGVPMLPVTHGQDYTRLQVLLYTLILFGVSLLPYAVRMSGVIYLASAVALGAAYLVYAVRIYRSYSDELARSCFRYSIAYLAALFAALLVDHYLAF
jgi:protoheme IX farnesyltransferase